MAWRPALHVHHVRDWCLCVSGAPLGPMGEGGSCGTSVGSPGGQPWPVVSRTRVVGLPGGGPGGWRG